MNGLFRVMVMGEEGADDRSVQAEFEGWVHVQLFLSSDHGDIGAFNTG